MNETKLYIGDNAIDLKEGQVIATTIKRIEIGDIQSRFVNYTNQFKGIWTERNKTNLGHSDSELSQSPIPYTIQSGRVSKNGIDIIRRANIILKSSNGDEFDINVYENVYDYFKVISGLKLSDISPIANSAWTVSAIDSARTNTSGIITVVLNWGKSGAIYQPNYFLPCFFYHSIVRAILEYTGLELSGSILSDSRFTDLVMPFNGDEFLYPETFTNTAIGRASPTSYLIPDLMAADGDVRINLSTADYGSDNFDLINNEYESPDYFNLTVEGFISVSGITWNDGTVLTGKLYKTGGTLIDSGTIVLQPTTSGTLLLEYTGDFITGDQIYLTISGDAPTTGTELTIDATSYLKIVCNRTVNRASVNWNKLWKDVSCSDILKDFFTRFSIIPKQQDGVLFLESIEDIINDRAGAVDWSQKLIKADKNINFGTTYAQVNDFMFSDSVGDVSLGSGSMDIANTTLLDYKEYYTTVFQNCKTESTNGYNVATIPVYDTTSAGIDVFAGEPGIKLLTLKARTTEGSISFDVSPRTDYKLGYFVDMSQPKDTGWGYFLNQFYRALTASLQKNKVIKKLYRLTDIDIADFDHHKIIYDGEGYYLVNNINNFVSGKFTVVEVFKVT